MAEKALYALLRHLSSVMHTWSKSFMQSTYLKVLLSIIGEASVTTTTEPPYLLQSQNTSDDWVEYEIQHGGAFTDFGKLLLNAFAVLDYPSFSSGRVNLSMEIIYLEKEWLSSIWNSAAYKTWPLKNSLLLFIGILKLSLISVMGSSTVHVVPFSPSNSQPPSTLKWRKQAWKTDTSSDPLCSCLGITAYISVFSVGTSI